MKQRVHSQSLWQSIALFSGTTRFFKKTESGHAHRNTGGESNDQSDLITRLVLTMEGVEQQYNRINNKLASDYGEKMEYEISATMSTVIKKQCIESIDNMVNNNLSEKNDEMETALEILIKKR